MDYWTLTLRYSKEYFHFAGARPDGSIWVPPGGIASAKKFESVEDATAFAVALAANEPEVLGALEILKNGDPEKREPV